MPGCPQILPLLSGLRITEPLVGSSTKRLIVLLCKSIPDGHRREVMLGGTELNGYLPRGPSVVLSGVHENR